MKERPIIFSAPMVRAILEGRKTQTRRVAPILSLDIKQHNDDMVTWGVKFAKPLKGSLGSYSGGRFSDHEASSIIASQFCPYGKPGDRLWVRETFQRFTDDGEIIYKADPAGAEVMNELKRDECLEARWRPSIHMPRWASRILLEVVSVHVERLNDISEADAIAEGVSSTGDGAFHIENDTFRSPDPVECYARLWESINGPGSWEANPWVWAVEFKRVQP